MGSSGSRYCRARRRAKEEREKLLWVNIPSTTLRTSASELRYLAAAYLTEDYLTMSKHGGSSRGSGGGSLRGSGGGSSRGSGGGSSRGSSGGSSRGSGGSRKEDREVNWYDDVVREEQERERRERTRQRHRDHREHRHWSPDRSRRGRGVPEINVRRSLHYGYSKKSKNPSVARYARGPKRKEGGHSQRSRSSSRTSYSSSSKSSIAEATESSNEGFSHLQKKRPRLALDQPDLLPNQGRPSHYEHEECRKYGVPAPRHIDEYKDFPRGKLEILLVVVWADGKRHPAWSAGMAARIRHSLNDEISKRAKIGLRSSKDGGRSQPPILGGVYDNHDHTQVRIDVGDEMTERWVGKALGRIGLAAVRADELDTSVTWYTAALRHQGLLHLAGDELHDIIAYQNGFRPEEVQIGEGRLYGRRELVGEKKRRYVVYIGLNEEGKAKLRAKAFILKFGSLGPAWL
jgi:hypothetical protein